MHVEQNNNVLPLCKPCFEGLNKNSVSKGKTLLFCSPCGEENEENKGNEENEGKDGCTMWDIVQWVGAVIVFCVLCWLFMKDGNDSLDGGLMGSCKVGCACLTNEFRGGEEDVTSVKYFLGQKSQEKGFDVEELKRKNSEYLNNSDVHKLAVNESTLEFLTEPLPRVFPDHTLTQESAQAVLDALAEIDEKRDAWLGKDEEQKLSESQRVRYRVDKIRTDALTEWEQEQSNPKSEYKSEKDVTRKHLDEAIAFVEGLVVVSKEDCNISHEAAVAEVNALEAGVRDPRKFEALFSENPGKFQEAFKAIQTACQKRATRNAGRKLLKDILDDFKAAESGWRTAGLL